MAYKALENFYDLIDEHLYNEGDEYPRKGYSPAQGRVKELAGSSNKMGRALIAEVKAKKKKVSEDV